jgi:hypothetical protein
VGPYIRTCLRGVDDAVNTTEDPIVTETRAVRRELSERFGNDVNALCDFLVAREREHEDRLVNLPPKPPQRVTAAGGERRNTGA